MTDVADPRLSAWATFYVIVGSSGAALIGVQFVVITGAGGPAPVRSARRRRA